MGMWLFLFTELLLFGGMFLLYAGYRFLYPDGFKAAALEMNSFIGAVNTIILLTSSLSIALSIAALQKEQKKLSIALLVFTLFCGLAFLVNKYFEWSHEIHNGIYPKGPALENMSEGEILYFGLYYTMTGLHGLHVIVGMIFIGVVLAFVVKNKISSTNYTRLENAGLYWHLVDIIWIFLFPLFYLIH
ncbi:MAG: cytochrome c oxidase subunit 3 family protein [Ignavibacteriae bacterium]|nr:MAG: cytochrome c oxidase subunit 3 family protein [Ignavibacteriota bacterium]